MLARTAMGYFDALAAQANAPVSMRLETAQGYVRLAQVTGGGQSSQLGLTRDSDALLARAAAIFAALEPTQGSTRLPQGTRGALGRTGRGEPLQQQRG